MKSFSIYLFFSFLVIAIYIEVSHFWVSIGGFSGVKDYIEIPVLLLILLLVYVPKEKTYHSVIIGTLPLLTLYLLYDLFYHFLKRSSVISDLENTFALLDFSQDILFSAIALLAIGFLPFIYQQYIYLTKRKSYTFFSIKIIIIILLVTIMNNTTFYKLYTQTYQYSKFSHTKGIINNGRFSSFIYFSIKEKKALKKLASYQNKSITMYTKLFNNAPLTHTKNIYIIVLESFIDPRLLKGISFNRSPLFEGMHKYLNNGFFDYGVSPVYGAGTAQAEFEILTGVKAYKAINAAEFNALHGSQVHSFINYFNKYGYQTEALIASKSNYYNSMMAYRSIGFRNIVFLEETSHFTMNADDDRIFDGDLFNYSLQHRKTLTAPYILYTLGMYGHIPYKRNLALRPDLITTNMSHRKITNISNQFYYRTKALSHYIDKILAEDPKSVILVTSDHLPPIINGDIKYTKNTRINISLLLIDGHYTQMEKQPYYRYPITILEHLSQKNINTISDKEMKETYFKLHLESHH